MITRSEAEIVLSKWLFEETVLRVDFTSGVAAFSVEGKLSPAAPQILGINLGALGFIEVFLDDSFAFEFFAPDAMRVELKDRAGRSHTGAPQTTGAGLVAASGITRLLLLEIV